MDGYALTLIDYGVAVAMLLAVAAELRPRRESPLSGGENHRLFHRPSTRMAILGLLAMSAGAIGSTWSSQTSRMWLNTVASPRWPLEELYNHHMMQVTLAALACALLFLPAVWRPCVTLTPTGVILHPPWYMPWMTRFGIRWEHVGKVWYSRLLASFIVENEKGSSIWVSIHLARVMEFAAAVRSHVPADRRLPAREGWDVLRRRFPEHAEFLAELIGDGAADAPVADRELPRRVGMAFLGLNLLICGLELCIRYGLWPPEALATAETFAAIPWVFLPSLFSAWIVWSFHHPLVRFAFLAYLVVPWRPEGNGSWFSGQWPSNIFAVSMLVMLILAGILRGSGIGVLQRRPKTSLPPWRQFSLRSMFVLTAAVSVGIVVVRELSPFLLDVLLLSLSLSPVAVGLVCLLTPGRLALRVVAYWLGCLAIIGSLRLLDRNFVVGEIAMTFWLGADALLMTNLLLIRAAGYRLTADPRLR